MSHKENLTSLHEISLLSAPFPCKCGIRLQMQGGGCNNAYILSIFVGWISSLEFRCQDWFYDAHYPTHSQQSEMSVLWNIISRLSDKELRSFHALKDECPSLTRGCPTRCYNFPPHEYRIIQVCRTEMCIVLHSYHRLLLSTGCLKRALQLWKLIEIYTEDIHNVLNCQNVAKHTEFYLG